MRKYAFEKLEVWQLGKESTVKIYNVTSTFPDVERFGITSQMRRACISVPSNLAEGTSHRSPKEKRSFVEIAYDSLIELLNQLMISVDLGFLSTELYLELRSDFEKLSNKMNALRNSI